MRELRGAQAMIIFAGTNDPWDGASAIISRIDKMLEYNGNNNAIIVSQWSDDRLTLSQMLELELAMLKRYGARFFNLRQYAVKYAMADAGFTPSAGDATRMANGLIPLVLTIDSLHPTAKMYELMAIQFKKLLIQTGLIKGF